MDYLHHLQMALSEGAEEDFETFQRMLAYWKRSPYSVEEFYAGVTPLIGDEPHLVEGLRQWVPEKFSKVLVNVLIQLSEAQSASPLLSLPRELRDKIWDLVTTDNVIHISKSVEDQPKRRGRTLRRKKYHFHMCCSTKGYDSVACPPGIGDHALCSTSSDSNYGNWRAACKQMSFEMPDVRRDVLTQNALQFADLETAEQFVFGLNEEKRASITHLRLALPHSLVHAQVLDHWDSYNSPWYAICNYFSNPWDRSTLHMSREKLHELKKPIYFYYSYCYYRDNSHRLYDRWQVGRGGTSWDIGISDIVYLGCPRLDLAKADPTQEEYNQYGEDSLEPVFTLSTAPSWIQPLLQFRNYDKLKFDHYSPGHSASGAVKVSEEDEKKRDMGITALRDYLRGGPQGIQGPQVCAFFAGQPYGSGNGYYNYG